MNAAPTEINGATVICYSPIDRRHRPTGNCRHTVAGAFQGPATGVAICRLRRQEGYYLFGCDAEWNAVTDTWHGTLDDALNQAEFEYDGISATWQTPI